MAENEQARPVSPAHLCLRCGLCCSGVIFDRVRVQENELDKLTPLEFEVTQEGDEWGFRQPCRMFSGGLCSVYDHRPAACRRFECKLLRRYGEGGITEEEANSLIGAAKSLTEKLSPLLQEGESIAQARKRWRTERERIAGGDTSAMDAGRARFHLAMASLNVFLDRHFRSDNQKVMTDRPLGGSDEALEKS